MLFIQGVRDLITKMARGSSFGNSTISICGIEGGMSVFLGDVGFFLREGKVS